MSSGTRRQVLFVVFFLVVVLFFVTTFRLGLVQGDSMVPTYHNGQVVLVWKKGPFCPALQRNDVILLRQRDDVIIKRIYRLPGEVVDSSFPDVRRQAFDTGLSDFYEQKTMKTPSGDKILLTVPKGYLVVLGDNLPISDDSRVFGPVPIRDVLGVVAAPPPPPYEQLLGHPGILRPRSIP